MVHDLFREPSKCRRRPAISIRADRQEGRGAGSVPPPTALLVDIRSFKIRLYPCPLRLRARHRLRAGKPRKQCMQMTQIVAWQGFAGIC